MAGLYRTPGGHLSIFFHTHHRQLSTSTSSPSSIWHLLRSHSPPPPLETALSNSIPNPTPSLILSVLNGISSSSPSDLPLALRFFVWAGLHPLHRHSHSLLSSASSLLRLPSHPHLLLHHLLDHQSSPPHAAAAISLKTFKILLSLSLHSNHPFPTSLSLLLRMPAFSVRPDVPFFNSLLRHPSASSDDALSLFHRIKKSGLTPNISTYVTLIKRLCDDGRGAGGFNAARNLLSEMRENGCSPNVVIYSALLDGACCRGDMDSAAEILEQMEAESSEECKPNVVSYTCLMRCLCESGRMEAALAVLDRMVNNGCKPNRVTLRTLIKGFCDGGRVGEAYKVVERVSGEVGGVSSEECYSLLVLCLLRAGEWEKAEGLFGRMLERGVRPDGLACNSLMREICQRGRFLDGYNWVGALQEKGMGCVDSDVYSNLLAGLCDEGLWVEAVKLGRMVVEIGVQVEDSCVDSVLEAMEKIGEGDLASQIVRIKEENESRLVF